MNIFQRWTLKIGIAVIFFAMTGAIGSLTLARTDSSTFQMWIDRSYDCLHVVMLTLIIVAGIVGIPSLWEAIDEA